MRSKRGLFAAAAAVLLFSGCAASPAARPVYRASTVLDGAIPLAEALEAAHDGGGELSGFVLSGRYRIAARVYLPPSPRGTLLIVHGYGASAAVLAPLARLAAEAGYAAVAIDLPGHGLSDGARGEIGDMREYGDAVAAAAAVCRAWLPRPLLALGHSAGALGIFDAAERSGPSGGPFDAMLLVAPLTRSAYWDLSLFGYLIVRPYVRTLSDGKGGSVSLPWFGALVSWRREAEDYPRISMPSLVLLGGSDKVVDGNDARRLLSAKLADARFVVLPWMGHHDIEAASPDLRLVDRILGYMDEICAAR